jgi:endonuclease
LTLDFVESPKPEFASQMIRTALEQQRLLIVIGRCSVQYKGRASSSLEPGERLLVIKRDGAMLIHRPTGYRPVNWQPSGCRFEVSFEKNLLRIRAVRQAPSETITTTFDQVNLVAAVALKDAGVFSLDASEQDMQKAIIARPEIVEPGLRVIEYEKRVEPGFVDLYAIDCTGRLVIIEIKRKAAGREAAFQLAKYLKAMPETPTIRPILVAPSLSKGTQRLILTLGIEFRRLDPKLCAKILEDVKRGHGDILTKWI